MRKAVDCHYRDEGHGECIAFVHGIGASGGIWDGVVERLAPRYRCVRMDLRGHGRSPKAPLPCYLDDFVVDLEHLRRRLGVERMHVFGHSLGGMIAPAYALAFPRRVRSLGLLSTAAGRSEEDFRKVMGVIEALERDGLEATLDLLVARWFTEAFHAAHPEVVEARRAQTLANDEALFTNVFHVYAETELGPKLGEIDAPSLVLTGERDGGCNPRLARFIAERIPRSRLCILEGLKHAVLLEAPERVAERLLEFLRDPP